MLEVSIVDQEKVIEGLRNSKLFLVLYKRDSEQVRAMVDPAWWEKNCAGIDAIPVRLAADNTVVESQAKTYLVGSLLIALSARDDFGEVLDKYFDPAHAAIFRDPSNLEHPNLWMEFLGKNPELWNAVLDGFDQTLTKTDRRITVLYSPDQFGGRRQLLNAALFFWFQQAYRWQRLQCKIFLPSDLLKQRAPAFQDFAKLRQNILLLK